MEKKYFKQIAQETFKRHEKTFEKLASTPNQGEAPPPSLDKTDFGFNDDDVR